MTSLVTKRLLKKLSLNKVLLNIFRNFIPNKVIKVDYKYPSWINPKIISSLRNRSKLTKRYYSNPTEENKTLLTTKSNECSNMIVEAKERYTNKLSKKLDYPSTIPKAYWSILNTFLNDRKIPNIPPLNVNVKIISNFGKKAELFNSYFAPQCTLINNSNVLPLLEYKTNGRLAFVNIKEDDIYLILNNLNLEKAHGWDNISIRMIQLY